MKKFRQVSESEPSIQLAFEAMRNGPPTNWTYKKAALGTKEVPKVKRPMAHQLIQLTLEIREKSVKGLKELFDIVEEMKDGEGVEEMKNALRKIRENGGWLEIENQEVEGKKQK